MKPFLPYLAPLDDAGLRVELPRVVQSERSSTVVVVARLAEYDERRLYLGDGFSSLFAYCSSVLKLTEHEAFNRIAAARAVRRQPELLDRLANGSLSLTTLRIVAPHVSDQDKTLLEAASGKTRREVEKLVVARLPEQPPVSSVRKLPELPPSRRPEVAPVPANQYRITITVSLKTKEALEEVQDLLRHQVVDGDASEAVTRSILAFRGLLLKKKLGAETRRRKGRPTRPGSRHLPAEVKRAVWKRDGARCAFVARDGRRCGERGRLEFHHIDPYALGGEATVGNISLRCRAHNVYESEVWFGHHKPVGSFQRELSSGPDRRAASLT